MSTPSILIIGGSGRLGLQLIQAADKAKMRPSIHVFVRNPSSLTEPARFKCASVVKGDARNTNDVSSALHTTRPDIVIMAVGVPNSTAASDLREMTAKSLVKALKCDQAFNNIKVIVISSNGSGGSKIKVGFGIGSAVTYALRHVLADHDRQEDAFKKGLKRDRFLIVRPTSLTDGKSKGLKNIVTFGDNEKPLSIRIDRADVAKWIMAEVASNMPRYGSMVNLTTK